MKLLSLLLLGSLSLPAIADSKREDKYRYAGDMQYAGFCKAIVLNDLGLFKRNLKNKMADKSMTKKALLRKLTAKDGITCNGSDLVNFSMQREASEVYAFITKQQ